MFMHLCKMRRIVHWIFALMSMALASCGHTAGWAELDRADSLILERPDSALAIIEALDSSALRGREEQARYALLHSMALDKNALFREDFDVLQPAIDYYTDHGIPDERLRMNYYRGRIHQNRGETHLALTSFMHGEELRGKVTDTLTFANMLVCHGMILHVHTMFDEMNALFKEALPLYEAIGRESHRLDCLAKLLNGAVMVEDKALADSVIAVLNASDASPELKNRMIYPDLISYAVYMADKDSVPSILRMLPPDSLLDGYTAPPMAMLYARIGQAERGRRLLESSEILDSAKYYSIAMVVYDSLHDYRRAYEAHAAFTLLDGDEHLTNLEKTYAFSNIEYKLMRDKEGEVHSRDVTIMLVTACAVILVLMVILLLIKIRSNRLHRQNMQLTIDNQRLQANESVIILAREKAERHNQQLELEKRNLENERQQAELEKQKLENQKREAELERTRIEKKTQQLEIDNLRWRLRAVEDERDRIQEILDIRTDTRTDINDERIYTLLRSQVEKLNEILRIGFEETVPNGSRFKEWYVKYTENREEFLTSLIERYRILYPGFIEYLESSGLDFKEKGFTCLVAFGLRNKAIGNYFSSTRHNHMSVSIRGKLRITSSRISAGIQDLLKQFDPQYKGGNSNDQSRPLDGDLE